MPKQMRKNLIALVSLSAVILVAAILVEYKWDIFSSRSGSAGFMAQVSTPAGGPGGSTTGAGAAGELDSLPDWIFSDVSKDHPNARAIYELKKRDIMKGRDDGTFQPDKTLLKVETLVLAMRGANIEADESLSANPLVDIQDTNQWFYHYVNTAYHNEIIKGDKDNKFNPTKLTNLAEFLVMTTGALNVDLSEYQPPEGYSWYQIYANYAEHAGLIDSEFVANQTVSRAAGAEILWRLLLVLGKA